MLGNGLARKFQRSHGLFTRNGRVIFQELIQTFACFEAVKQIL